MGCFMQIELFTFTYNDEDLMPFFLKHYTPIVDKMTFIDSGSTDKTLAMIKGHNVIHTGLTWWDWDTLHEMRQNIWRNSQADLIFFPDLDEFFYKPDLRAFLEANQYDIYQLEGYQMVTKAFPSGDNILNHRLGIPLPLHNKYTIFNPKINIDFPDAHSAISSSSNINRFDIKLLHYKYLGAKHMAKRARLVFDRVPKDSFTKHVGVNGNILQRFPTYVKTEKEYEVEINDMVKKATVVI